MFIIKHIDTKSAVALISETDGIYCLDFYASCMGQPMNVPRSRKAAAPVPSPFEKKGEGYIEPPPRPPYYNINEKASGSSSTTSKSDFSKYASAIQQGLYVNSYDQPKAPTPPPSSAPTPQPFYHRARNESTPASAPSAQAQPQSFYTNSRENFPSSSNTTQPPRPSAYQNIFQNIPLDKISMLNSTLYANSSNFLSVLFAPPPAQSADTGEYDKPLLEELGIDFNHIYYRFRSVMMFKRMDAALLKDSDIFGPFCILVLFGISLMLTGRLTFSLLYAIEVFGSISMYILLNCISDQVYVDLYTIIFVLGYSTLPIIPLPILYNILGRLWIGFGIVLCSVALGWSTAIATMFFESILRMNEKRYIIAYPTLLFFTYFSLVAVL